MESNRREDDIVSAAHSRHETKKSADPHFKARQRNCISCDREFTTTPLRRLFCKICWKSKKNEKVMTTAKMSRHGPRGLAD